MARPTFTHLRWYFERDGEPEVKHLTVAEVVEAAYADEAEHIVWAQLEQVAAEGHIDVSNLYYHTVEFLSTHDREALATQMSVYRAESGFEPEAVKPDQLRP